MTRLDIYISENTPHISRSRAKQYIEEERVLVNGNVVTKASLAVEAGDKVWVDGEASLWVSRGAHKLLAALEHWSVDVGGKNCLDIGASTGGFTQVLLERGAEHVVALDVGYGQLHPKVSQNERVTNLEHMNIRSCTKEDIGMNIDVVVIDVSFISLTLVLPVAAQLLDSGGELLALVKPQFEVGKGNTKKGIVSDEVMRENALQSVIDSAIQAGFKNVESIISPIVGGDGNVEYLIRGVR